MPRTAGRIVVRDGRAWVHSATEPGHRVLQIQRPASPPEGLPHGEARAPAEPQFSVLVNGESTVYRLTVSQRLDTPDTNTDSVAADADADAGGDPETTRHVVSLTDRQREIIDTYLAPVRRGRPEPATHAEVAAELHLAANTVRSVLYDIYEKLFLAGIPMVDHSDKRVAVVDAFRLHGIETSHDR